MKVVLNSPDRLVLRDLHLGAGLALLAVTALPALMAWGYFRNGILSGGFILAAIALLLFLGCFGAFIRPLTVTLDRPGNRIEIVERSLFDTRRQGHVLSQFRGATTQSRLMKRNPADDAGKSRRERRHPPPRVWRAVLVHRNGHSVALTEIYGRQAAAETAAAAINGWIGRPEPG